MPNPSVMPCTAPKPAATQATPASAPEATGTRVRSSAGRERYTASSSTTMSAALIEESRTTSLLMMAREATANTGGPLIRSLSAPPWPSGSAASTAANARRMASHAACCASVSDPAARVCTSSSARVPSGELHTPSVVCGACPGPRESMIPSSSPVGSRANKGLTRSPSGEASLSRESLIAARSPCAVKRCRVTSALSR